MAKKFDGVVEAVRYKSGQIVMVRAFERRGAAFSDRILMDRKELLGRLKDGKRFVTGKRTALMVGSLQPAQTGLRRAEDLIVLQVVSRDGKEFVSTRDDATQDELEQVPVF